MANVCTNMFYAYSECVATIELIREFLDENFDGGDYMQDANSLEGEFNSRWVFPEELFTELGDILKDDETLCMRCLSYEFGCEYACLSIYRDGVWVSN